ncbi:MAG: hypothetical protein R6W90_17660 [Ignavibacteriaceae bacterium]
MKKITIILIMLFAAAFYAQTFKVDKVSGEVKAQTGTDENWVNVKTGMPVNSKTTLVTSNNSSVHISSGDIKFRLNESSAINAVHLKKVTLDDLLLALAMDDMINAPKKKENNKSKSTVVYGTKEGKKPLLIESDDFGIKKLNGAVQIAEAGFKESAVIAAKETFRKYPETNLIPPFRIYFAGILTGLGLYEEAYEDFSSIKKLKLSDKEKKEVEDKLEQLNKKLSAR